MKTVKLNGFIFFVWALNRHQRAVGSVLTVASFQASGETAKFSQKVPKESKEYGAWKLATVRTEPTYPQPVDSTDTAAIIWLDL